MNNNDDYMKKLKKYIDSTSFNWKQYIENYKDLQNSGINNKEKALEHWYKYGIFENRIDRQNFNWKQYIENYQELQNSGINNEQLAINHWNNYGKYENKTDQIINNNLNNNNTINNNFLNNNLLNNNFLNNIMNNLINKCICFIHLVNINNGYNIFLDQINHIKSSGLYNDLDFILVTLIGPKIDLPEDNKIKLIYYSDNYNEWEEFPCFKNIKYFSNNINSNVKILYLHTKDILNKSNAIEWRKYLEYFLIEKYTLCLKLLDTRLCVGVNPEFYLNINDKRNHFSENYWWSNSKYIKTLPEIQYNSHEHYYKYYLIGDLNKTDYRYIFSMHNNSDNVPIEPNKYNLEIIKTNIINNLQVDFTKTKKIFGIYYIFCMGNYYNIVSEQINLLVSSGLYDITDQIYCFICNYNVNILQILNNYPKIIIISTNQNLYEKYAINNYKNYVSGDYYLYYFHSKSVSRRTKCYNDWRKLCDYFTLKKWRLSIELLNYYDCVGINMKTFPKLHYSGNFWWSKSSHLNKLININNNYLSSEMYICTYPKTNKICIYNSNVIHYNTEYNSNIYENISDIDIINNISIISLFNENEKKCININDYNKNIELPILN